MPRSVEILVRARRLLLAFAVSVLAAHAAAQEPSKEYQPQVGQAGKDVVWVPMPEEQIYRGRVSAKLIEGTTSAIGAAQSWKATRP
jgi:hypothetical protein